MMLPSAAAEPRHQQTAPAVVDRLQRDPLDQSLQPPCNPTANDDQLIEGGQVGDDSVSAQACLLIAPQRRNNARDRPAAEHPQDPGSAVEDFAWVLDSAARAGQPLKRTLHVWGGVPRRESETSARSITLASSRVLRPTAQ